MPLLNRSLPSSLPTLSFMFGPSVCPAFFPQKGRPFFAKIARLFRMADQSRTCPSFSLCFFFPPDKLEGRAFLPPSVFLSSMLSSSNAGSSDFWSVERKDFSRIELYSFLSLFFFFHFLPFFLRLREMASLMASQRKLKYVFPLRQ